MDRYRQVLAFCLLPLLSGVLARAQQAGSIPPELVNYPDFIIYNAKIATMDDPALDNSPGRTVQAMAIRSDRIQFLGTNDEMLRFAGPGTRKIDMNGRTVIPGIIARTRTCTITPWRAGPKTTPQK